MNSEGLTPKHKAPLGLTKCLMKTAVLVLFNLTWMMRLLSPSVMLKGRKEAAWLM
ncbi:MAG: hypothetical protein HZB80_09980 [Deltaproteobacteria bacterium]|nr:hypothetical protein [Deltaproteobacteria bacterium]